MSRRVEIRPVVVQGGKVGLLSGLAQEVVREMRAEGRAGLVFDPGTLRFASKGSVSAYAGERTPAGVEAEARARHGREVQEAESRYGLKLQKLREEQVVANAEKRGYTLKKRVEESGKVKLVLRRRVYA